MPDFVRIESMVLQLRKILELVAFGSLVANIDQYRNLRDKYAHDWRAELILADIERLNPHLYPQPVEQTKSTQEAVDHVRFVPEADDSYVRRSDFSKVYGKCAALLHAENPYGGNRNFEYYQQNLPIGMRKIERLLSANVIRLVSDSNYYLIQMRSSDGKPHHYTISPAGHAVVGLIAPGHATPRYRSA